MINIKRALISVTAKEGVVEFARGLSGFGVEILSTGGTATLLKKEGIPVIEVSDYTGFPEMMDGRLKTLHPKIHGGLLAIRSEESHMASARKYKIQMIDMVVVNLYRFEDTVNQPGCTLEKAIENIDIGGPTAIRGAAKNHKFVAVVTDPGDYQKIIAQMKKNQGCISESESYALAVKAFQLTARYDGAISNYLGAYVPEVGLKIFPDTFTFQMTHVKDLRYGENPYQRAALYKETDPAISGLANARQLQGKELSYNNIMDGDAAWQMVSDFRRATAAIIKHTNPCGAASSNDIAKAYLMALEGDPISAFGGIVALNRPVDDETAAELIKHFFEIIIAPAFSEQALKILSEKRNLRLLEIPPTCVKPAAGFDFRRVAGGLLVQDWNTKKDDIYNARVVTKRQPTNDELLGLEFAWLTVKHVKSNAIVYAINQGWITRLVSVGAGQMSRVDSVKIANMKSILETKGCVMASDAFFPFPDGIIEAAKAGITAIVQPGGSDNDHLAIEAADLHNMAMIFTGNRYFKH